MAVIVRFKPTGIEDINDPYVKIPPHEIIEAFLFAKWNTTLLPKNTIKFSYKMKQNVSSTARNALKCYWDGSETTSLETNDTLTREITRVGITLEVRHINNFVDDTPQDLITIRNIVRDIINGNRLALQNRGIFMMTFINNDKVIQDETNNYIYRMKVAVRCTQHFEKILIEENTQLP